MTFDEMKKGKLILSILEMPHNNFTSDELQSLNTVQLETLEIAMLERQAEMQAAYAKSQASLYVSLPNTEKRMHPLPDPWNLNKRGVEH